MLKNTSSVEIFSSYILQPCKSKYSTNYGLKKKKKNYKTEDKL